ncbi:MAG TPA: hypothetical protein VF622_11195 [Segetibacter sp.]|jgi:hypothetical protein
MYARIARRKVPEKNMAQFAEEIRSSEFPNPAEAKGIIAYYQIDTAPGEITTVSVFDSANDLAEWDKTCKNHFANSKILELLSEHWADTISVSGNVKKLV